LEQTNFLEIICIYLLFDDQEQQFFLTGLPGLR